MNGVGNLVVALWLVPGTARRWSGRCIPRRREAVPNKIIDLNTGMSQRVGYS